MCPCPFNGSHQSPVIVSDPSNPWPLVRSRHSPSASRPRPWSNPSDRFTFIKWPFPLWVYSLTLLIFLLFFLSFIPTSHQMIVHSHSVLTHHPFTHPSLFVPIVMIFAVFQPFLPKSQAPTLVHSTHDMFSLSTQSFILSFTPPFILSSYSVISDIKDKSGLFGLLGDSYP